MPLNSQKKTSSGLLSTTPKGKVFGSVMSQRGDHVADLVDSDLEILVVPVDALEEKITHEAECDILEVVDIMQEDGNYEATIRARDDVTVVLYTIRLTK